MGEQELKAALRRESEVRARQLWHDAETGLANHREKVMAEIARLEERQQRRLAEKIKALREGLLLEAQQGACQCCLRAEAVLAEQVKRLALEWLADWSAQNRSGVWQPLLKELPEADWRYVRVHPQDRQRAKQDFPQATIETDSDLIAGMLVATEDRRVRIDNSLRNRLERAWPDLLPGLMADLRQELSHDGTDESTATS